MGKMARTTEQSACHFASFPILLSKDNNVISF